VTLELQIYWDSLWNPIPMDEPDHSFVSNIQLLGMSYLKHKHHVNKIPQNLRASLLISQR